MKKALLLVFIFIGCICTGCGGSNDSSSNPSLPPSNPQITNVSDITVDMKGNEIITEGYITKSGGGKGHTFITLQDPNNSTTIKAVLFKQVNEKNPERKIILDEKAKNRSLVRVKGKVDIYKNELEIVIQQVFSDDEM